MRFRSISDGCNFLFVAFATIRRRFHEVTVVALYNRAILIRVLLLSSHETRLCTGWENGALANRVLVSIIRSVSVL